MIIKRLQLIYEDSDGSTFGQFYHSWKEIHIFLFEHGLYKEFQVTDSDGDQLLHYKNKGSGKFELKYSEKVPGSILFEIVNKHVSAKL